MMLSITWKSNSSVNSSMRIIVLTLTKKETISSRSRPLAVFEMHPPLSKVSAPLATLPMILKKGQFFTTLNRIAEVIHCPSDHSTIARRVPPSLNLGC
jgi:hypothetical protein